MLFIRLVIFIGVPLLVYLAGSQQKSAHTKPQSPVKKKPVKSDTTASNPSSEEKLFLDDNFDINSIIDKSRKD